MNYRTGRTVRVQHVELLLALPHRAVVPRVVRPAKACEVASESCQTVDLPCTCRDEPRAEPQPLKDTRIERVLMEALVAAVQSALCTIVLIHHHLKVSAQPQGATRCAARAHNQRCRHRVRQRLRAVARRDPTAIECRLADGVVLRVHVQPLWLLWACLWQISEGVAL
eukprot:CAMPEP_0181253842 /NCGR_PEP_ID=MMETSP1096-20121128/48259_1 /TAXON_ID=156174 ORGANISM="Chrysochromulina ericina, Strain CCMP281" /NCGR_SAMPLE_ID=MMETSP1096 /ASSEMBLY_ACC=CAM_ASM_000453 /LENGTH=167 /DNA_ID=CAMNT_0023351785 /DNA_START=586 /DNA_END=1086 /DNA_ORIENTATION=+